MLQQFSISEDDVREEIERFTGYGTLNNVDKDTYLPYSPKAKDMLSVAGEEAKQVVPQVQHGTFGLAER